MLRGAKAGVRGDAFQIEAALRHYLFRTLQADLLHVVKGRAPGRLTEQPREMAGAGAGRGRQIGSGPSRCRVTRHGILDSKHGGMHVLATHPPRRHTSGRRPGRT